MFCMQCFYRNHCWWSKNMIYNICMYYVSSQQKNVLLILPWEESYFGEGLRRSRELGSCEESVWILLLLLLPPPLDRDPSLSVRIRVKILFSITIIEFSLSVWQRRISTYVLSLSLLNPLPNALPSLVVRVRLPISNAFDLDPFRADEMKLFPNVFISLIRQK